MEQGDGSAHCFVKLGQQPTVEAIHAEGTQKICRGVTATFSGEYILLEVDLSICNLKLGTKKVTDIAQVAYGQWFYIDDDPCAILKPRQVLINPTITSAVSTEDPSCESESEVERVTMNSQEAAYIRRMKRLSLIWIALLMLFISLPMVPDLPASLALQDEVQQVEQPPLKPLFTTPAQERLTNGSDAPSVKAPNAQAVSNQKPSPSKRLSITKSPLPQPSAVAQAPDEMVDPALMERFNEFQLEARFDPVGASRKLRELQRGLRKDHPLYVRIDQVLQSL